MKQVCYACKPTIAEQYATNLLGGMIMFIHNNTHTKVKIYIEKQRSVHTTRHDLLENSWLDGNTPRYDQIGRLWSTSQ